MRILEAVQRGNVKNRAKKAFLTALLSFCMTSIILLILAAFIEKGALQLNDSNWIIMLSAFFGTFPVSYIASRREGRGVLKTAMISGLLYCAILALCRLFAREMSDISGQLLKNMICAIGGFLFGGALYAFKKPRIRRTQRI